MWVCRDHDSSLLPWHSDDEKQMVPDKPIFSFTFYGDTTENMLSTKKGRSLEIQSKGASKNKRDDPRGERKRRSAAGDAAVPRGPDYFFVFFLSFFLVS